MLFWNVSTIEISIKLFVYQTMPLLPTEAVEHLMNFMKPIFGGKSFCVRCMWYVWFSKLVFRNPVNGVD